jgi:hypothetical protein
VKINPDAIYRIARRANWSLQVPHVCLERAPKNSQGALFMEVEPDTELPDDWFIWLRYGDAPAVGRELYYASLYLSPIGWEANRETLKAVYTEREYLRPWSDFENFVENHFNKVREAHRQRISKATPKKRVLLESVRGDLTPAVKGCNLGEKVSAVVRVAGWF